MDNPKEKKTSTRNGDGKTASRGNHLFRPGQSGNPSGRAKIPPGLRELARAQTARSIEVLVELRDDKNAPPNVRALCADKLLDRAWGKAETTSTMTIEDKRQYADEFSRAELVAYLRSHGADQARGCTAEPDSVH